jgi:DNA-binding MarR family transcriptional regulator
MKGKRRSVDPLVDLLGTRLSTATILFHAAVADRMGVSVTDAKCRGILARFGAMTAGELATRLGLTTGAVTGVIDRLERAGLVRRAADPTDRRRVVVEPIVNRERDREIARLFEPMARRIRDLVAACGARDQARIAQFLTRACGILEEEAIRLRMRSTA